MCIPPPPQPERLVMRKDEAVGTGQQEKLYAYIIISYYVLRATLSTINFNTTKIPALFLRLISLS
jgi:hypothetical protein